MGFLRTTTLALSLVCVGWCQTPSSLEFEAVSIKPTAPPFARPSLTVGPTRVTAVNRSLSQLMLDVYGLQDFQLLRPDWLDSVHFDLYAVAGKPASRTTLLVMLQPVLASRFKLELHRETRITLMYQLVVAKGGPKLKSADTETPMHI